jgi:S1-C subfamily serine protease
MPVRAAKTMGRSCARRRAYLTFATFAVLVAYQPAEGQESSQLPTLERQQPGVAEVIPNDVLPPSDAPGIDELSAPLIGQALVTLFNDSVPRTRGAQDISLFRNAAPSVVLVRTKNGFGTGSLLKDNTILTNRHVVADAPEIIVIFKPSDPSGKPNDDEVVQADAVKLDSQRDLALLRSASIPSRRPLDISVEDSIDVGTDVAAIGHPRGETWTFTKGIVSAFRPAFEWSGGPNDSKHVATVIQTQIPINPGNSGGPLLTEDGKVVGVNSFGTTGAENLNFAIAANEIRAFLANPKSDMQARNTCVKAKIIFEGRNNDHTAFIRTISLRCDDIADIMIIVPDNRRQPIFALVYSKRQDKPDAFVLDPKRSGKWTTSFWDVNFDGTFPLKGLHPDGKLMPSSYVQRCGEGQKPVKDFKCA